MLRAEQQQQQQNACCAQSSSSSSRMHAVRRAAAAAAVTFMWECSNQCNTGPYIAVGWNNCQASRKADVSTAPVLLQVIV
jgi:hypothetical protein